MDDQVLRETAIASMCCLECERRWDDSKERWRMLHADGEIGLYCPLCASFEFGPEASEPRAL
jgi:hypothetical protein